ncbi:hypothetical protein BDZ89DRAFT_1148009 [Hymenopellis radicata]|nr:hypothetical protein BDZ89DRAFT_1148009 [Hymenopellis radicata]
MHSGQCEGNDGSGSEILLVLSVIKKAQWMRESSPMVGRSASQDPSRQAFPDALELTIAGFRHSRHCPYEVTFKSHGGHLVERILPSGVSTDASFVQLYGRDRNSSRERSYFEIRGFIQDEESIIAYAEKRGKASWDGYFVRRRDQFSPQSFEILDMGDQHFPCILPPAPPRGVGAYEFFWMTRDISRPDEDYPYCFIKGRALDPRWIANPCPEAYYDWENRRVLYPTYAGDFEIPAGYLADVRTYGFPAPPWRVYDYDAGGLHLLPFSYWLYANPEPNQNGVKPYKLPCKGATPEYGDCPWVMETGWVADLDEAERMQFREQVTEPVIPGPFTEIPLSTPSSSSTTPDAAQLKTPISKAKARRARRTKQAEVALGLLHELEGVASRVGGFLQEIVDQGSSKGLHDASGGVSLESRLTDEPYSHGRAL